MTQYSSEKYYEWYNVSIQYTRSAQNDYRHFQRSADDDIQIYYHNIEDA